MSTLPPPNFPAPDQETRDVVNAYCRAYATAALAAQAAEVEALRDELRLCCELKREYQEQVASKVDEVEALRADAETRLLVLHNAQVTGQPKAGPG